MTLKNFTGPLLSSLDPNGTAYTRAIANPLREFPPLDVPAGPNWIKITQHTTPVYTVGGQTTAQTSQTPPATSQVATLLGRIPYITTDPTRTPLPIHMTNGHPLVHSINALHQVRWAKDTQCMVISLAHLQTSFSRYVSRDRFCYGRIPCNPDLIILRVRIRPRSR